MENINHAPVNGVKAQETAGETYVQGKLALIYPNQGHFSVGVYGTGSINPGQYSIAPNCEGSVEAASAGVAYGASFWGALDSQNRITRFAIYSPTWPK
jgi:hypothetical protein